MTTRPYDPDSDFALVSDFLTRLYQPGNRDGNWFQPVWEYARTHAWLDQSASDRIGLWLDDGRLVALCTYELGLGEAFFALAPGYERLKPELLAHAEDNLWATRPDGSRRLDVFINDFDPEFEGLAAAAGFGLAGQDDRPMSMRAITHPFGPIPLAEGFRLKSLADDNDLRQVHRVLHRGFNHPGEPPEDHLAGRRLMQSGPHYRLDLTIVVAAPTGEFVSFAGLWFDAVNRFAYVEPVATDPDYRRRGLGRAAVLEGIRRCGELGAGVAYVGTTKPFYQSMGFRLVHTQRCWRKEW